MQQIGVECKFDIDGNVLVTRINMGERWISAEQGRQWVDNEGRHVLLMLGDGKVVEIRLRPDTMTWEVNRRRHGGAFVV